MRLIAFEDFIREALIALDKMPYNAKTSNVIAINTVLSKIISRVGEDAFLETNSGRNAKKKIVNLGLSKLIAIAFTIICDMLTSSWFSLRSSVPASRHIFQAK